MSKKKALSTMTLKDFHGGSIPSDLPLPSAPGVIVRQADRASNDRQQWGRSDNRSRPNSASASRILDDRTPFLGSSLHIGRNFDEDERKPLDGLSGPRRTVSDESVRGVSGRVEVSRQGLLHSGSQVGSAVNVNSYSGRVVGGGHESVGMQSLGVSGGQGGLGRGGTANAWTARKEAAMGVSQSGRSAWSVQSATSKLAHASALEKVSSGLWQTKPSVHYQADIEVINHDDPGVRGKVFDDVVSDSLGFVDERKYYDEILASRTERVLNIDNGIGSGRKELLDHGRAGVPGNVEVREKKQPVYNEGVRPAHANGKYSSSEVHSPVPSEPLERPKLKLLPRTKPLENTEPLEVDHKPGYQQLGDRAAKSGNEFHGNVNSANVAIAGAKSGNHELERPRLNLQPKSQSQEQVEKERKALFGGARPREVVLKERGVDSIVNNHEMDHPADRVKHDASKTGRIPGNAISSCPSDKIENHPSDQRPGKKFEKKDHCVDAERTDKQKNWRMENWRNNKDVEKQKQKQQQERPPSPETWRKPVEEPRPASEAGGARIGKAASAVELAKAFSRSVSDSKMGDRSLPGRTQIPFSRLTGPMPRKQINGY